MTILLLFAISLVSPVLASEEIILECSQWIDASVPYKCGDGELYVSGNAKCRAKGKPEIIYSSIPIFCHKDKATNPTNCVNDNSADAKTCSDEYLSRINLTPSLPSARALCTSPECDDASYTWPSAKREPSSK